MAATTRPAASPQAADGRAGVGVDGSPGGLAVLRAAGGLPPGLLVTIAAPTGDNVIVAGTTSWHHRTVMYGWTVGRCATHPARPVAIVPGGRSRRVGGDRHASSRR